MIAAHPGPVRSVGRGSLLVVVVSEPRFLVVAGTPPPPDGGGAFRAGTGVVKMGP